MATLKEGLTISPEAAGPTEAAVPLGRKPHGGQLEGFIGPARGLGLVSAWSLEDPLRFWASEN